MPDRLFQHYQSETNALWYSSSEREGGRGCGGLGGCVCCNQVDESNPSKKTKERRVRGSSYPCGVNLSCFVVFLWFTEENGARYET